jgi:hypothetical protein
VRRKTESIHVVADREGRSFAERPDLRRIKRAVEGALSVEPSVLDDGGKSAGVIKLRM